MPWWPAIAGHLVTGKLVDSETREPVAGAIVVAEWHGVREPFLHEPEIGGAHSCYHVALSRTDDKGLFRITAPFLKAYVPRMLPNRYNELVFYKEGYKLLHATNQVYSVTGVYDNQYEHKTHELVRSENRDDERLFELDLVYHAPDYACKDAAGNQSSYVSLLEEIRLEAEKHISRYYQTNFLNRLDYNIELLGNPGNTKAVERPRSIRNPAYTALATEKLDALRYVIETGITRPNDRLASGETLLMAAAARGRADMVAYLLKSGADPTRTDTLGYNALRRAVTRLDSGDITNPSGYIEIVKMLYGLEGVDTRALNVLQVSRDPRIRALAGGDIESGDVNSYQYKPEAPLNIFSESIELTENTDTYIKFIIKDGTIKGFNEVPELPRDGEVLSLSLRKAGDTDHGTLALRTRMHGQLFMRVVLEGGNDFALPAQDFLIGMPPYNQLLVRRMEPDWQKVTITDFHLHNWPEEQMEFRTMMDASSPAK